MFVRAMQMTNPTAAQFDTVWATTQNYITLARKDTILQLVEHAIAITQNHQIKALYGKALFLKGKIQLEDHSNPLLGVELFAKASEILEKENETELLSQIEGRLGKFYSDTDELEKSLEHHLKSLDWVKATRDSLLLLIKPKLSISNIYSRMGSYEKALEFVGDAIKIMEISEYDRFVPPALFNQARIFQKIGDKHINTAELPGNDATIYRDSAELFYRKGLESASRSLEIAKTQKDPFYILTATITLAEMKNSLGDYQGALSIGEEGMRLAKKNGYPHHVVSSHLNLACSHRNLGHFAEALKHAQVGYEMVKKDVGAGVPAVFEEELYKIYKANGNAKMALEMLEITQRRQKQQHEATAKKAVIDAETKYRTLEKEQENLQLSAAKAKVEQQRNYIIMGGLLLGFLGFFGYRLNKVQNDRNDKKAFAEALIFAQEAERKRIARDLHDGIGQSLLLIKNQMAKNTEATLENKQLISDTLEEVRSISRDLHPFQLDKFGLTATINGMVEKVEESTDLFISREIDNIDGMLPKESEIHVFRTIQEALSNIVKHAGATAAKISIQSTPQNIRVAVQDNGHGFDLEMAVVTSKSLGIRTMHERISAIGGQLKIGKGPTGGTLVDIVVPKSKINS